MDQSYPQFIDLIGASLSGGVPDIQYADWQRLFEIAKANRMLPLLYAALRDVQGVPAEMIQRLKQESQRSFVATTLTTRALGSEPVIRQDGRDWSRNCCNKVASPGHRTTSNEQTHLSETKTRL